MKVPNKTPQQMVEFWERELTKIDEQEALDGITMWSRNFIKAKIQLWDEAIEALEVARVQREIKEYVAKGGK